MTALWFVLGLVAGCALLVAVALLLALRWLSRVTAGNAYFGLPLHERRALRDEVAKRFDRLSIVLRAIGALVRTMRPLSMIFQGVTAPRLACSPRTFAASSTFAPDHRDIFIATQMKCGTTWMQQVVYEVLMAGKGDLSDDGHRHMYALSPWIESYSSVSLEDAPRVGRREARIIKTHLPADLCPYDASAKYVYVTRHPVACYASCVDFIRMLAGPLVPPTDALLGWFCSERMWWRSWPDHVEGWWRWSEDRSNVLFVHYEEMLDNLPAVVHRVAAFLDASLSDEEKAEVVRKSTFEYMKANEEVFEMSPPTPFSGAAVYLKSGKKSRDKDVEEQKRQRILAFCRERLAGGTYPAARFYPDLARD